VGRHRGDWRRDQGQQETAPGGGLLGQQDRLNFRPSLIATITRRVSVAAKAAHKRAKGGEQIKCCCGLVCLRVKLRRLRKQLFSYQNLIRLQLNGPTL
jgi:hypothetical protein